MSKFCLVVCYESRSNMIFGFLLSSQFYNIFATTIYFGGGVLPYVGLKRTLNFTYATTVNVMYNIAVQKK